MTHRPPVCTTQLLQCLRTRDELLVQSFNRLQLIPRAQHRQGSQTPGPLESRRRAVKRRHGAVSAASGGGLPLQDFGTLFGFKLSEAPRPDFENSWRWEAPVSGSDALARRPKENGDWRPWMRSRPRTVPDWDRETRVAEFLAVPEDPIEASRTTFANLLEFSARARSLREDDIRDALNFLQGPSNEPDAQLTLRLVQWLRGRDLTTDCIQALAKVVAGKSAVRTMSEQETSSVFIEVLQWPDAQAVLSATLNAMTDAVLTEVVRHTTASILATSLDLPERMDVWLQCLRSSAFTAISHHTSEVWRGVYEQLAQHYSIADLAEHLRLLEGRDLTLVVLKHWVPRHLGSTGPHPAILLDIEFKSRARGWVGGEWHTESTQHNPLVDLLATLIRHNVPYCETLVQTFEYWEKTLSPAEICRAVWELQACGAEVPPEVATSVIHHLANMGAYHHALSLLGMLPTMLVEPFQDVMMNYLRLSRAHGQEIWRLIDRWVEQARILPGAAVGLNSSLPPTMVDFIHEMAKTWAHNTHLRPRVALRRVWECFRFLIDHKAEIHTSLSGALVRAGAINYIRAVQPLSKRSVQYILGIVETLEGPEVREQAEKMVFDHWRALSKAARGKVKSQLWMEKLHALQYLKTEGHWVHRRYKPRISRPEKVARRERDLFEAGQAVEVEAREDYDTLQDVLGDMPADGNDDPADSKTSEDLRTVAQLGIENFRECTAPKHSRTETAETLYDPRAILSNTLDSQDASASVVAAETLYDPRAILSNTLDSQDASASVTAVPHCINRELPVHSVAASNSRASHDGDLPPSGAQGSFVSEIYERDLALLKGQSSTAHPAGGSLSTESSAAEEIRAFYQLVYRTAAEHLENMKAGHSAERVKWAGQVQDHTATESSSLLLQPGLQSQDLIEPESLPVRLESASEIEGSRDVTSTSQPPNLFVKRFLLTKVRPAKSDDAASEQRQRHETGANIDPQPAVRIHKQLSLSGVLNVTYDAESGTTEAQHPVYSSAKEQAVKLYVQRKAKVEAREKHDNSKTAVVDIQDAKWTVKGDLTKGMLYLIKRSGSETFGWEPWEHVFAAAGARELARAFHRQYPQKPISPPLRKSVLRAQRTQLRKIGRPMKRLQADLLAKVPEPVAVSV